MSRETARIVFDLDGTLVDSAPDIRAAANRALAPTGCAPLTLEETARFVGSGAAVFVARARAARDLPEADEPRLLADFLEIYETAVSLTHPYPGVRDALAGLARDGHALGLCTNKPIAPCRALLAHLDLAGPFATVLGGDSLPTRKPDPAPLLAAFEALGEGPRLFVGDSEIDEETAARAGVPFLLFTGGYRRTPVEGMRHAARFDHWSDMPACVDRVLTGA